jgi:hypothetical protein
MRPPRPQALVPHPVVADPPQNVQHENHTLRSTSLVAEDTGALKVEPGVSVPVRIPRARVEYIGGALHIFENTWVFYPCAG